MISIQRAAILVSLPFLSLAVLACDDDNSDQAGGAESQLCSDLYDLAIAGQRVDALTPASTVDEAEDARDDVEEAMEQVRESAEDVASARTDDLEQAVSDFQSTVNQLEGSQTIGQASAELRAQSLEVTAARRALSQQANCPA
jgi:hypothetical protein